LTTPTFLVSSGDLNREEIQLRSSELRHLRARRLGPGDDVVLTDGTGRRRYGTIVSLSRAGAEIRLLRSHPSCGRSTESPLQLELALAALKSDKLDLVIEKATELGASSLVVFTSSRCVSRPAANRLDRWQRVARSATKQCQRSIVPPIKGPVSLSDVLSTRGDRPGFFFWEGPTSGRLETQRAVREKVLLVVGPEGGFDTKEVAAARAAGFAIVGLGPHILRAETAAIAAVTLCHQLWGDL